MAHHRAFEMCRLGKLVQHDLAVSGGNAVEHELEHAQVVWFRRIGNGEAPLEMENVGRFRQVLGQLLVQ